MFFPAMFRSSHSTANEEQYKKHPHIGTHNLPVTTENMDNYTIMNNSRGKPLHAITN